jgi:hypothetical protein
MKSKNLSHKSLSAVFKSFNNLSPLIINISILFLVLIEILIGISTPFKSIVSISIALKGLPSSIISIILDIDFFGLIGVIKFKYLLTDFLAGALVL